MSKKYEIDLPLNEAEKLILGFSCPLEDMGCCQYFYVYGDNGKNRVEINEDISHGNLQMMVKKLKEAISSSLLLNKEPFYEGDSNYRLFNGSKEIVESHIHNDKDNDCIITIFPVYPYNTLGKKTNLPLKEWKRQYKPFIRTVVSRERLQLLVEKLQKIYDQIYSNGIPPKNPISKT